MGEAGRNVTQREILVKYSFILKKFKLTNTKTNKQTSKRAESNTDITERVFQNKRRLSHLSVEMVETDKKSE